MTTLITGAGGFVGGHLVNHLLAQEPQQKFICVDRSHKKVKGAVNVQCDLTDRKQALDLMRQFRPSVIYHLAGQAKVDVNIAMPEYFARNVLTTTYLLDALSSVSHPVKVFLSSSVHVYGNQGGVVAETAPVLPKNPYAFTKYLAERVLEECVEKNTHVSGVVGRLHSCLGPGQPLGFVAADLIEKILKLAPGESLVVGSMEGTRAFLDVRDAVACFPPLLAAARPACFEVFNVALPKEIPLQQLLDTLLEVSGKSVSVVTSGQPATNSFRGIQADTRKLVKMAPSVYFRPLKETIREMYEFASRKKGG